MNDLEARIAEVLGAHTWQSVDIQGRITCHCGQRGITGDHDAHQAAMLAPVIRGQEAEAWDVGYTVGNAHNGRRDANPYRSNDE